MSHEITERDGMVLTAKPAWHGLGVVVDKAPTAVEALTIAKLDWQVIRCPVAWHGVGPLDGSSGHAEGFLATVRADTGEAFDVASESYTPLQNRALAETIDGLRRERPVEIESAGSLRGGRDVFFLVRMPAFSVGSLDDEQRPYCLFVNNHTRERAFRVLPTVVRVVCNNTLRAALSSGYAEGMTLRHTGQLAERIASAVASLKVAASQVELFKELASALHKRMLSDQERGRYYLEVYEAIKGAKVTEAPKTVQETELLVDWRETRDIWRALEHRDSNAIAGMQGTAWQALNVVTDWADHGRRTRRTSRFDSGLEARTFANWLGASVPIKAKALASARALVSG